MFFFVSRCTRSLIFANCRKKHKEKTQIATSWVTAVRLRHNIGPGRGSSRTGWFSFFLCLWLHAQTAVVQDLRLAEGDWEDRDLPRKVWLFHVLLVKSWPLTFTSSRSQITEEAQWPIGYGVVEEAQCPIGYGVGLRIKRSSVRIRPWPLRWVLGQGSLLPLSQGEAFTLASISYLAILVKYILAKKK